MMDRMEKEPLIQEGRRLPDVADIDGLVSFMGRLTEEQESFYLDLLLASLVRLHPFIKSDDVKRMMPVFEWAGTVMEMPESETGGLDKLTTSFLLDYAEMLSGAEKRAKGAKQQPYQDYKPYLDLVKLAFNRIKDYNTTPAMPAKLKRKRVSNRIVWTFKLHFRVWHWMIRTRLSGQSNKRWRANIASCCFSCSSRRHVLRGLLRFRQFG